MLSSTKHAPVTHSKGRSAAVDLSEQPAPTTTQELLIQRRSYLGPNMALFFPEEPLQIVRGQGAEIFDAEGAAYLDCINNVAHVGHCHPRVAAAVSQQLLTLNTNSRYLHPKLTSFAERLTDTMPDPLQVMFPVCSGSEANDLAWRIATAAAVADGIAEEHQLHVVVMDHAYHGHTKMCTDLSPYKFNGPGGAGKPAYVHVLPCPDVFRGLNLDGGAAARKAIAAAQAAGGTVAAFFCESVISCGGQVVLPEGYLKDVYREMHAVGALCVADEVQCGFGRVGSAFWGFELQDVVPDIVTCGKPMGNGYPMAALVTNPTVAAKFANGMEFFATFGGSTAAAAAGMAVLDVLRDENLQQHANQVGSYIMNQLYRRLMVPYPKIIGHIRGVGLMIGIELVTDATTKGPAPALARFIKLHAKSRNRVLLSTEGPYSNIIKVKPPMCFTEQQADRMIDALVQALVGLTAGQLQELEEASKQEVAVMCQLRSRI